jgi:hypothetical protein
MVRNRIKRPVMSLKETMMIVLKVILSVHDFVKTVKSVGVR